MDERADDEAIWEAIERRRSQANPLMWSRRGEPGEWAGTWAERDEGVDRMSDLRETVERHVQWAINMPEDAYDGYLAYDATDRILAAVAEAMTSDAAALQVGLHVASDTLAIVENREPFIMGSIPYTENGRRYITAALTAAGITKGDVE